MFNLQLVLKIFLFLYWCATKDVHSTACGIANNIQHSVRITNGYKVGYYKYPWFAALIEDNQVSCGGSLIGPSKVVTAAHCYKPYLQKIIEGQLKLEDVYTVRLGVNNFCQTEPNQGEFKTTKVELHEKYFDEQPYFDIAILTLDRNTSPYMPICLPQRIVRTKEGLAQGFGRFKFTNESVPCEMQEARLLVHPDQKCVEVINSTGNNGPDMKHAFCAGYLEGIIDTCLGDSGGPLLFIDANGRYVLQGITSFGFGCAQKDLLGVYTDVSHFLKWIYNKTSMGANIATSEEDVTFIQALVANGKETPRPPTTTDRAEKEDEGSGVSTGEIRAVKQKIETEVPIYECNKR